MECFYVPGSQVIVDVIDPETERSSICDESLSDIQKRFPGAEVWDFDRAWEEIKRLTYSSTITPPHEITAERWEEMLGVLPPMKWRGGEETETFMLCEATSLDLHLILCRIGERFFQFTDKSSLTHQEIVMKCSAIA